MVEFEAKFTGCKLEIKLESQTPLIHFQAKQDGVTLRASEVKPKLDRFIIERFTKENGTTLEKMRKDNSKWFLTDEHNALNYKMKIVEQSQSEVIGLGKYRIFWGNPNQRDRESGKLYDDTKYGVFSNPSLTIICMNAELRKIISQYIVEFFFVTNFGTMQGKGFGGFVPTECAIPDFLTEHDIEKIGKYIQKGTGIEHCYCMLIQVGGTYDKHRLNEKAFNEIKRFYQIMKAGNNSPQDNFNEYLRAYMVQYMHGKNIDNEKAWMKEKEIAPKYGTKEHVMYKNQTKPNPRYTRALLGLGSQYVFINKPMKSVTVEVKHKSGQIERVPSPIFFKIVKNTVFIVAKEVPRELFNQEFQFSKKFDYQKQGILSTPTAEEFDIQDFLKCYVDYYNKEAKKVIKNLPEVKQVEV